MADQDLVSDDLATGLTELTRTLVAARDIEQAWDEVAAIAARMVPEQPMAAVTLKMGGHVRLVAATDAPVARIEEVQHRSGRGPVLEALDTAAPVSVPDIGAEQRWAECRAEMLAEGIRSVHCEPLIADGPPIVALNFYSTIPHAFDRRARRLITIIAAVVAAATAAARQAELSEQLRAALASRSVIDQALGIIMGRERCTRSDAAATLRDVSQRRNTKLAVVAADVIRRCTGADPEGLHFNEPGRPPVPPGKRTGSQHPR
ncbi:GAF and ANTAR domain-containing protein [Nocardia suismassiliense]|uniref:GAF and ANTAR domain-containing protein n=1 Tax=Nocardia suismassiliense TaxID=2077092 RepID=UPI000D1F2D17|nr:GAF and ANTAR domain-containing protein [Nocardia suismassiliense]